MLHFLKYNLIGVLNTLITLIVVWILHQLLDVDLVLSNFLGFVAGGANSYVCNRVWNFKSAQPKRAELPKFLAVFVFAYLVNLVVLKAVDFALVNFGSLASFTELVSRFMKPGFFANLVANAIYVVASFGLFKFWVFKGKRAER